MLLCDSEVIVMFYAAGKKIRKTMFNNIFCRCKVTKKSLIPTVINCCKEIGIAIFAIRI